MSITIPQDHCFHCGLPNTEGLAYPVTILSVNHFMCCPGCQAVAQSIVENGLENYYEFRTEPAQRGDTALENTMAQLAVYDEPELQEEFVYDEGKHSSIQLTVEGITCAACAWLIEKQLAKLEGIKQVSVNVSARRAMVVWDKQQLKLSGILSRLKSIGYDSLPFQADQHEASYKKEHKSYVKKLGLAGIMTMQVMMLAMGQYFDILGNIEEDALAYFNAVSLLLTTPVVFYSGSIFYLSAFKALMAKTVNMDVPITIAIFATYTAGLLAVNKSTGEVYFESICMFVFFLLISRFLEHRARHRASLISSNMLKLIPVTANKKTSNGFTSVLAKQLVKDDIVLVKAGETVPVDGAIIEGKSSFDESMLTGEFAPVTKETGATIYAGSLNQEDTIIMQVRASIKHAMMNQILRMQESALMNKPKIATTADRLSRFFVFAVLFISISTYSIWTWLGNPEAFWITISILVATCPCALGLATPSALTCAMAKLNQIGILLKRADALEQLTQTTDIVFDKTGTLTQGRFSINKIWANPSYFLQDSRGKAEQQHYALELAILLESRSEHPIAKAFNQSVLEEKGSTHGQLNAVDIEQYNIEIGKGISAIIKQQQYMIGSRGMLTQFSKEHGWLTKLSDTLSHDCDSANVFLANANGLIAAFWLTDTVVEDAYNSIQKIQHSHKEMGISARELSILSGDGASNVEHVAKALGINNIHADCSPQDKLNYIAGLQSQQRRVVMLGDGINDAPVLAAADVSIAVGNASDLAKNSADIVLLNPKLSSLIDVLVMASRTKAKIKQNIAWALGYNILVLPFAILGYLTPWQAALGMSLSSIVVVYNSTRLMK